MVVPNHTIKTLIYQDFRGNSIFFLDYIAKTGCECYKLLNYVIVNIVVMVGLPLKNAIRVAITILKKQKGRRFSSIAFAGATIKY